MSGMELARFEPRAGEVSHASRALVPQATVVETARLFGAVFLPTIAKGVIIRRRAMMRVAELLDLDRRAIRCMQHVRASYGTGPIMVRLFGRRLALILDPQQVHRVLAETPEPFASASFEKRAALAHFEPKNVLISSGSERADRRRYNEQVLDADDSVHRLAGPFLEVVNSEASRLCRAVADEELTWDLFADAWFRTVRRIVFGEAAAEDHELSRLMAKLRYAANWAFLRRPRTDLRNRLLSRIREYIANAAPGSLAGLMAHTQSSSRTAPEHQAPQWLFAFDPAGMATFRSLALLASHRQHAALVRQEIEAHQDADRRNLPMTRAVVLESLRLWPTSPLLLRETTAATAWDASMIPAGTGIIIYTPFFHRDDERLPYADRFSPELWDRVGETQHGALIPFSEGPAVCPGRHLVLLLSSAMIAAILDHMRVRLIQPADLAAKGPLPATLDHYRIRFECRAIH